MNLVIIESPYAGMLVRNVRYARACVLDSLMRGESPLAFHILHTQEGILNDQAPEHRELGIRAGLAWTRDADLVAVYTNFGISPGMELGITEAKLWDVPVTHRVIDLTTMY